MSTITTEPAHISRSTRIAQTPLSVGYLQGGRPSGQRGKQIICTIFDKPTRLRRIRLEFLEMESARTQEFSLQWSAEPGGHSARSFASSGVSARKARQVKSKTITSI